MTDHTGAGNVVGSARKAKAERDHDCERGHSWSEVRVLGSVVPVGFVCLKCPLVLHVRDDLLPASPSPAPNPSEET